MFIPKNEMGVFYLFSKIHKELGFEEIVSFQQYPDVIAKRNGKTVKIELEYRLTNFRNHFGDYRKSTPYPLYSEGKRQFSKEDIDIIICWTKDGNIEYPVEIIELKPKNIDKA